MFSSCFCFCNFLNGDFFKHSFKVREKKDEKPHAGGMIVV